MPQNIDDAAALVERFAERARAAVAADKSGRNGDARRLRRDMRAVIAEIGERGLDADAALAALRDDPVIRLVAIEAGDQLVNHGMWLDPEPAEHGGLPSLGADELQPLATEALLDRFAVFAVEYEGADGSPPYEDLYGQIDGIQREFERRGAPRTLLKLYAHDDVRVRALAAQFTMSEAPELARDRLAAIDDEFWSPPVSDAPKKRTPQALGKMSVDELAERYVALSKERYAAMDNWEVARPNRLLGRISAISDELDRRGAQAALLPYLGDSDNSVRVAAAWLVRSLAPDRAVAELKRAAALPFAPPLGVQARGMLTALNIDWTKLVGESPYIDDDTETVVEPPGNLPLFLAAWRDEVAARLRTIAADDSATDRFVALTVPAGYVQAMVATGNDGVLVEASSGFFATPEGAPRTEFVCEDGRAALARLGFSMDDSAGNFRQEVPLGDPPDFGAVATLLLTALHEAYGAGLWTLVEINAPLAKDGPGRAQ